MREVETWRLVVAGLINVSVPVSILTFLTCFLVYMGQGRHDTAFTRLCNRMLWPSAAFVLIAVLATLRYL